MSRKTEMLSSLWRNTSLLNFYSAVFGNVTSLLLSTTTRQDNQQQPQQQQQQQDALLDEILYFRARINGIGGTSVAVFGIVCNIISIVVLANYKQKSSTPFLLIILAVYDSIALFSEMMLETVMLLSRVELISRKYFDHVISVYVVMYPVPHVAQTGSIYMTVLITIERFIAVVIPFQAVRYCKISVAWKACLVIFAWAVVYHAPMYMAYTYTDGVWNDVLNATGVVFKRTAFGTSFFYNEVYVTWINFVFDFLLPFVAIAVLNVLILKAMRTSRQQFVPCEGRQQTIQNRGRDTRMTVMVLAVTAVFFVCQLFTAVAFVMMRGLNKYSDCSLACNNFTAVADLMILVNSAVNFILYCAVGKKFREIFVHVFCNYRQSKTPSTNQTELSDHSSKMRVRQPHNSYNVKQAT